MIQSLDWIIYIETHTERRRENQEGGLLLERLDKIKDWLLLFQLLIL